MLATATPFPYSGSRALLTRDGTPIAVTIIRNEGEHALVSGGPAGASGTQRVAFGALVDATPLTADEAAECGDLAYNLSRRKRRPAVQVARLEALRSRGHAAETLASLLRDTAVVPARMFARGRG